MSEKLLAFQISGSHYKKWDQDNGNISSSTIDEQSVDECFDTIAKKIKDNPKDKVRVAVSVAAEVEQNNTISANNFPVREQKRGRDSSFEFKIELEKKLHQAGLSADNLELNLVNDAEMQLKDASLKYKLKKGDRAIAVNLGTGFNLKDGSDYKGDGEFSKINSKPRIPMPEMDKYSDLEGPQRSFSSSDSLGSASAYITGGHKDNPEHGPRGTLNHLFKLMESFDKEDKKKLRSALKLLIPNKGIKARLLAIIGLGNRARLKKLEKSTLKKDFEKTKELSNEAIENAAKEGDELGLALLHYLARRTAGVLKAHMTESKDDIKAIYIAGGFANGLYNSDNKHLKTVRKELEKELKKFTKAKLEIHNPELDGAIEYLKLNKSKK